MSKATIWGVPFRNVPQKLVDSLQDTTVGGLEWVHLLKQTVSLPVGAGYGSLGRARNQAPRDRSFTRHQAF